MIAYRTEIWSVYRFFNDKNGKIDDFLFGAVRAFCKKSKTVRFLERYGSRYKILTENGNELCTVRFALISEKTEHGGLFGAVRLAVKNRNGNGVFLLRFGKRFSLKNGKRYGFRLRCRGFSKSKSKMVGPETVGYGTVRSG